MTKLKSSNINQISPFMSSLFTKVVAESNIPLGWIKNKDMPTMAKMVNKSDDELVQDNTK